MGGRKTGASERALKKDDKVGVRVWARTRQITGFWANSRGSAKHLRGEGLETLPSLGGKGTKGPWKKIAVGKKKSVLERGGGAYIKKKYLCPFAKKKKGLARKTYRRRRTLGSEKKLLGGGGTGARGVKRGTRSGKS